MGRKQKPAPVVRRYWKAMLPRNRNDLGKMRTVTRGLIHKGRQKGRTVQMKKLVKIRKRVGGSSTEKGRDLKKNNGKVGKDRSSVVRKT